MLLIINLAIILTLIIIILFNIKFIKHQVILTLFVLCLLILFKLIFGNMIVNNKKNDLVLNDYQVNNYNNNHKLNNYQVNNYNIIENKLNCKLNTSNTSKNFDLNPILEDMKYISNKNSKNETKIDKVNVNKNKYVFSKHSGNKDFHYSDLHNTQLSKRKNLSKNVKNSLLLDNLDCSNDMSCIIKPNIYNLHKF